MDPCAYLPKRSRYAPANAMFSPNSQYVANILPIHWLFFPFVFHLFLFSLPSLGPFASIPFSPFLFTYFPEQHLLRIPYILILLLLLLFLLLSSSSSSSSSLLLLFSTHFFMLHVKLPRH